MAAEPERPLDKIVIRDLTVGCVLGTRREERENRQDVLINVALWADLRKACQTDDIRDTVDYKTIKQGIVRMVEKSSFFLIERLAQRVADICLEDPRVQRVEVTIDKPGALRFARSVAITLVRQR